LSKYYVILYIIDGKTGGRIMKKFLIIALVVIIILGIVGYIYVMNPFNVGIDPLKLATRQFETGKRLEISFTYSKQRLIASSQYAFWIEDMSGRYIDTVYVTQWTAQGGYNTRPHSIPQWVSAANPSTMNQDKIDAISGATPRPGDYIVRWDFTDKNGNTVTGSQYRFFFEGTMNNDDTVLYSGIIKIEGEAWEIFPDPVYSIQDSNYKNMLSNVKIAFFPR